jgi:hypothetical protein
MSRWHKCHGGTNVTVAQMSRRHKCHEGTNVSVAQMTDLFLIYAFNFIFKINFIFNLFMLL